MKTPGKTEIITPEEMRAVYSNQASFILSASGSGPGGDLPDIFDMVNRFYHHWGTGRVARVEVSVKVCGKGISRNRYAVAVNPWFEMDMKMMDSVLESMNAPPALIDIINRRHGERIRMGVGTDRDGGIRKVYFSEGEKIIYAYGFREDGGYGAKMYRVLRDGGSGEVRSCVLGILGSGPGERDMAALFGEKGGHIVYDRFAVESGTERHSGYHISAPEKPGIGHVRGPLARLARLCCPGIDGRGFDSWIDGAADGYLFWVGMGKDPDGGIELSLYARNVDY